MYAYWDGPVFSLLPESEAEHAAIECLFGDIKREVPEFSAHVARLQQIQSSPRFAEYCRERGILAERNGTERSVGGDLSHEQQGLG